VDKGRQLDPATHDVDGKRKMNWANQIVPSQELKVEKRKSDKEITVGHVHFLNEEIPTMTSSRKKDKGGKGKSR
jgi:hypothetical protein